MMVWKHRYSTGFLLLVSILGLTPSVWAQVRQSTNYQIQSDSINIGGGLASSTNYVQESTVGEIATGPLSSATYNLYAGYQQMQEVYLAMTTPAAVTMAPALDGLVGGTSSGTTTVTVTTDGPAGYQLTIAAENEPAMQSYTDTIADYVPALAPPDFLFSTAAGDAHFAFSPFGDDVVQRFLNDTNDCDAGGTSTAGRCWDGLATTSAAIAESALPNHPTGTETSIAFRVGIGASVNQTLGTYVATTTLTLLPL